MDNIIIKGNYDFTLFFCILCFFPYWIIMGIVNNRILDYVLVVIFFVALLIAISRGKKTIFYKTKICDYYLFWWEQKTIKYDDIIAIRYNRTIGATPNDFTLFYEENGKECERRFVISYKKAIKLKEWIKQSDYSIGFIGI